MTELERLQKAKIPCKETGIEVKHTFCSVCEPLFHCGIDAYVKDGRVVKIEGTPDYPVSNGNLCPKGHANRQYIYRADRIQTPLRRTGPRGSGQFEEISWEEAYREIAARLKQLKAAYGPESVLFYSGLRQMVPLFPPAAGPFLRLPQLRVGVLHLSHGHSGGVEGYGRHLFRLRRAKRSHLHGLGGQSLPLQTDSAAAAL